MSDINEVKYGFPPVYDRHSIVLILGSFPSVKSREISFYYGNKQNRFWKMICTFFSEDIPDSTDGKREFLLSHQIALWDVATSCTIEGSKDDKLDAKSLADLSFILNQANVQGILLNGTKAYELFLKKYKDISIPYYKMPSTSPANPRFQMQTWWNVLNGFYHK